MAVVAMLFSFLGLLSPQLRGALIATQYVSMIFLSNISGYYAARIYKMFQGTEWLACAMLTSMVYPVFVFVVVVAINLSYFFESSSATVPFPTLIIAIIVYCGLSIPNVWFGAFLGFKKSAIKNPGKVNKLSRDIPKQPWYIRMKFLVPIGGIFPFA